MVSERERGGRERRGVVRVLDACISNVTPSLFLSLSAHLSLERNVPPPPIVEKFVLGWKFVRIVTLEMSVGR